MKLSFSAYGERRDTDWDGPISAGDLTTLGNTTRHGFTDHEHLDSVGLIHMGGRVYDPVIGRFLSRDPYIDGVGSSQGANGYAYVWNNPLTRWDPTGYGGEVITVDGSRIECNDICNIYDGLSEQSQRDLGFEGTPATVIVLDDGLEEVVVTGKEIKPPPSRDIDWAQFLKDWWPGYGLGTCIYESYTGGGCGSGTWIMAGIGTIPLPAAKGPQVARGASTVLIRTPQGLQKFFTKHGGDFGLRGNWNPSRAADASRAIHQHINNSTTRAIEGTYRGNPVTHYLDSSTGLNIIATPSGNFVSGWTLGAEQLQSVLATGRLF